MQQHDGTRELVFEPLELLERLAAMTPRPETNLLISHGLLAARARGRARVVAYGRAAPGPTALAPLAAGAEGVRAQSGSRAWSWAALMHQAFAIDVLACPHCGGRLRLIATLHDPAVIRKLLAHWGWLAQGRAPVPHRPRPDRLCEGAMAAVVPARRGVIRADPARPARPSPAPCRLTAAVCRHRMPLSQAGGRRARRLLMCAVASVLLGRPVSEYRRLRQVDGTPREGSPPPEVVHVAYPLGRKRRGVPTIDREDLTEFCVVELKYPPPHAGDVWVRHS